MCEGYLTPPEAEIKWNLDLVGIGTKPFYGNGSLQRLSFAVHGWIEYSEVQLFSTQNGKDDDNSGGFEIKYLNYPCRSSGRSTGWKDEGVSLTLDTSSVRNAASYNDCEHCSKVRHRMPFTRARGQINRPSHCGTENHC